MIKIYPPTPSGTKEMFDDFEKADFERKQALEDQATELAIEAELEEAHEEKLASKALEDTEGVDIKDVIEELEGEHPSVHGDSPGINAIGDERK